MADFILDSCVEDELWAIWSFIAVDNPDAATRVVEAAYDTFKNLADNPEIGRQRYFRNARLSRIRSWRVSGFENYLILYLPITDGVRILHVYHGAQDLEALLGD